MLRLRPSELTLTPDDVEETFRRMARRQVPRGARHGPSQSSPARPILRRGPERAVRDALTTLGDIPILRPQPQHAAHSSVNEDIEDQSEQVSSSRERADSASDSFPCEQDNKATPSNVSASAPISLQLPLRLGRSHRDSASQVISSEQHAGGATVSPPQPVLQTTEDLAGLDRSDQPQREASQTPPMELRGGGRSSRHRRQRDSNDIPSPTTPLPEEGTLTTPRNREPPILHLEGYFTDPVTHPKGPSYSFREVEPEAAKSEPRLGTTSSSLQRFGMASSFHNPFDSNNSAHQAGAPRTSSFNPALHGRQPTPRPRQFSSEASAISEPFSFYELPPESRQASSEDVQHAQPSLPQYDGTAASRPARGGFSYLTPAYMLQRSYSQQPMAHPNAGSQFNTSPQFFPYGTVTRTPPVPSGINTSSIPSQSDYMQYMAAAHQPHPNTHPPLTMPGYMNAATAAVQGLPSPLESSLEHYQRLATGLQSAPTPAYTPPTPHQYTRGGAMGSRIPQQGINDVVSHEPRRLGLDEQHAPQPSAFPAPYHPTTYYGGISGSSPLPSPHVYPAQYPVGTTGYYPTTVHAPASGHHSYPAHLPGRVSSYTPPTGRSSHAVRASQRSSENAPVRPAAHASNPSRNSQVQIHRAAFERLHNAMQDATVPQPSRPHQTQLQLPVPRDTSNRPRVPTSSQSNATNRQSRRHTPHLLNGPPPPYERSLSPQADNVTQTNTSEDLAASSLHRFHDPNQGPRERGGGTFERTRTRSRQHITSGAPTTYLHPSRNHPSTSLALDHANATSLRSPAMRPATLVRSHRRIPPQQRDQENSGVAEDRLMRREETAIQARYGVNEQNNTMNETPPRIGPVERRMFS